MPTREQVERLREYVSKHHSCCLNVILDCVGYINSVDKILQPHENEKYDDQDSLWFSAQFIVI